MKIRRLQIEGFGCVQGREVEFDRDRASLLIANNEQGKSTLALSILALLYGLPEEGEGDGVPALRAFQPWGGGAYRARATVECKRGTLVIERDFGNGAARVFDESGADVTREFETRVGLRIGEKLVGLSRPAFAKTAFVRQNEILAMKGGPELTRKLKATADSEAGFVTVEEAIDVLEKFLSREGEGLEREVAKRQGLVLALQKRHDVLSDKRQQADDLGVEVEKNFGRERDLLARIRRAEYLGALAAERLLTARIDAEERRRADVAALEEQAASLRAFHDFPAGAWDEIQRLSGKLETIDKEIASIQAEFDANIAVPKRDLEKRRAPYLGMNGMAPGDADKLSEAIAGLKTAQEALQEKKGHFVAEEERLSKENVSLAKYDDLDKRYGKLSQDDCVFLAGFPVRWKQNKASHEEKKGARDKANAAVKEVEAARAKRRRVLGVLALSLPLLLCAAGVFVKEPAALHWGLFGAAGVALLGFGVPFAGVGSFRRGEQDQAEAEAKQLGEEIANVEGVLKGMEGRLREMGQKTGISKLEQCVQLFAYYKQLEGKTSNARALRAERDERAKAVEAVQTAALVWFQKAKRTAAQVDVEACERLLADLRESFKLTEEMVRLSTSEADVLSRRGERAQARREAHAKIRHLLRSGGVEAEEVAQAIAAFEEARGKHFRRRELVEKAIPSARAPLSPESELLAWKGKQRDLRARLEQMRRADGTLARLAAEREESAYLAELREATEELTRLRTERLDLLRKTGELLGDYRREAPTLARELAEEARELIRARGLRRSVQVAVDTLREITSEIYMKWATELNRRSTKVLSKLTPDYEGVRFKSDLTFSIFRKDLGRDLKQSEVDALLSTGAKDQVYLAVRLALADYFSTKGESLPLILDDPFASADDQRFLRAMEYITTEMAGEHQVILLTCHERRHRWWLEETHAPATRHLRVIPFP